MEPELTTGHQYVEVEQGFGLWKGSGSLSFDCRGSWLSPDILRWASPMDLETCKGKCQYFENGCLNHFSLLSSDEPNGVQRPEFISHRFYVLRSEAASLVPLSAPPKTARESPAFAIYNSPLHMTPTKQHDPTDAYGAY
ncbi:hypothetical protein NC653_016566 [Populus alba x Populus x berolinensis]|uniref:Uncharacterized protein n=1 Tax=Populus alba x Populus x berolinensis TaxID=444605 RepID=A0AAD6QN96_9ROSI|nr:hypothetical protein NC653_016566 [Populus alba x Populus x berolinensis]